MSKVKSEAAIMALKRMQRGDRVDLSDAPLQASPPVAHISTVDALAIPPQPIILHRLQVPMKLKSPQESLLVRGERSPVEKLLKYTLPVGISRTHGDHRKVNRFLQRERDRVMMLISGIDFQTTMLRMPYGRATPTLGPTRALQTFRFQLIERCETRPKTTDLDLPLNFHFGNSGRPGKVFSDVSKGQEEGKSHGRTHDKEPQETGQPGECRR